MKLKVSSSVLQAMKDASAAAAPSEACGLLLGQGEQVCQFQPAINIHAAPHTHFEIDSQTLIDAHRKARSGGLNILGYFHSHPAGPPEPSRTDCALAAHDGKIWAIAGQGEVKFWRDLPGRFEPLCYAPVNG